jgi:hypothetical protein
LEAAVSSQTLTNFCVTASTTNPKGNNLGSNSDLRGDCPSEPWHGPCHLIRRYATSADETPTFKNDSNFAIFTIVIFFSENVFFTKIEIFMEVKIYIVVFFHENLVFYKGEDLYCGPFS